VIEPIQKLGQVNGTVGIAPFNHESGMIDTLGPYRSSSARRIPLRIHSNQLSGFHQHDQGHHADCDFRIECAILHSFGKACRWKSATEANMFEHRSISTTPPLFSIVIAVYDDWISLDPCLRSMEQQIPGPEFEVIVVDDGSAEPAPERIREWSRRLPLTIVRQSHAGISAARNCGIQTSRGSVLLFVDADCRMQTGCLATLAVTIADSPQHNCFQLHIVGDHSRLVGRAEDLRLRTFQQHMLQPDCRIRYLNTAGFAIRRTRVDTDAGLFDPIAVRAEDTLLLANLMQVSELPLFVANATIQHTIPLSLPACFLKDIRSAFVERRTYDIIASKGVRIRVNNRERLRVLASMWKTAGQESIGRSAWFVLVARQTVQRVVSFGCECLGMS
jgi:glycosyltransferase involved in cell wall biosynthesis